MLYVYFGLACRMVGESSVERSLPVIRIIVAASNSDLEGEPHLSNYSEDWGRAQEIVMIQGCYRSLIQKFITLYIVLCIA